MLKQNISINCVVIITVQHHNDSTIAWQESSQNSRIYTRSLQYFSYLSTPCLLLMLHSITDIRTIMNRNMEQIWRKKKLRCVSRCMLAVPTKKSKLPYGWIQQLLWKIYEIKCLQSFSLPLYTNQTRLANLFAKHTEGVLRLVVKVKQNFKAGYMNTNFWTRPDV